MSSNLWLPTIPMTLVDAINRCAAATGSPRYAMVTSDADYNGHPVSVAFNDYRKYWVTEYYWGGRVVLCRGSVEACLRAGHDEYKRGAKGCRVIAGGVPDSAIELATSLGYLPYDREAEEAKPLADDRFSQVGWALQLERQMGCPAVSLLVEATSKDDYDGKVKAWFESHRSPRSPQFHI